MTAIWDYLRDMLFEAVAAWNEFWFTPSAAETLGLIRFLTGLMLLYTHTVWTLGLRDFFGPEGALSVQFSQSYYPSAFSWSYLYPIDSLVLLWVTHVCALVVLTMFCVGVFTRVTSVLAFVITVSYAHRAGGTLFGLDQINGFLTFYLMVGPSGDAFSIDRWRRRNKKATPEKTVSAGIAIRLIQLHMCIVYFFAATGKLLGETWWNGTALWGAFANLEYQTLDMTWLARWPYVVNFITHLTLGWELSYCGLIWPRFTRSLVLALAIPLHLGIAFCMGMITFGLIMLVGNLAFVPPELIRKISCWSGSSTVPGRAPLVRRRSFRNRSGSRFC